MTLYSYCSYPVGYRGLYLGG